MTRRKHAHTIKPLERAIIPIRFLILGTSSGDSVAFHNPECDPAGFLLTFLEFSQDRWLCWDVRTTRGVDPSDFRTTRGVDPRCGSRSPQHAPISRRGGF